MKNSVLRFRRCGLNPCFVYVCVIAFSLSPFLSGETSAQLFGARTLGRPLSTRANSAELGGSFRIRRTGGFVGSDRRDASRFIGRSQAATGRRPRSATAGIRTNNDSGGAVNRPIQQTGRTKMYLPRLVLAEEETISDNEHSASIGPNLNRRMKSNFGRSLQVTIEGQVATLTGTVDSAKTRRIAELVVGFEPGVSHVQNDLQVAGDMASPPAEPRANQ